MHYPAKYSFVINLSSASILVNLRVYNKQVYLSHLRVLNAVQNNKEIKI